MHESFFLNFVNCRTLIRCWIIWRIISRFSTRSSKPLYIRCFPRRFWKLR